MGMVNMLEARTSLSKLVEAVESGAEEEIIIARNGKPAAKLVAIDAAPKKKIRLGLAAGKYPPLDYEAFQAMDAEIEAMFLGEVRFLLDTHVAIWATNTPQRMPDRIRELLEGGDNKIAVSVAAIWEITIKHPLGRADAAAFRLPWRSPNFSWPDLTFWTSRLPMLPSSSGCRRYTASRSTG